MQPYPGRALRDMRQGGAAAVPPAALQPQPMQPLYGQRAPQGAQAAVGHVGMQGPADPAAKTRQNTANTMNHMESSVTRLLFATKMLLESLTQWCRGTKSETDVSDVYVRLGNDFKVAISAFSSYGIDMSDLYSIPPDLRVCLEDCLSEPASPAVLDRHLPRIREIIIRMLEGLKRKQQAYKELVSVPNGASQASGSAPGATPTLGSAAAPGAALATGTGALASASAAAPAPAPAPAPPLPRRPSAGKPGDATPERAPQPQIPETPIRDLARAEAAAALEKGHHASDEPADADLRALRSRDALERRASKRFSAYTINKMGLGGTVLSTPLSGAAGARTAAGDRLGRSPITPGRFTTTGDVSVMSTPRPVSGIDTWTPRADADVSWVSEPAALSTDGDGTVLARHAPDNSGTPRQADAVVAADAGQARTPKEPDWDSVAAALPAGDAAKAPLPQSDVSAPSWPGDQRDAEQVSPDAASAAMLQTNASREGSVTPQVPQRAPPDIPTAPSVRPAQPAAPNPVDTTDSFVPEPNSAPVPEPAGGVPTSLTLFLQLGPHTRKVNLDLDHSLANRGLSVARLRMLFVDQFAYSPGMDDFPDIYIKDPSSGIQYHLEDLDDVHDKSLLTLNIQPLDQVRQHMDLSLGGINKEIRELKQLVRELRERERVVERVRESRPPEQVAIPISDSAFSAVGERIASDEAPNARGVLGRELKSQYQELQRLRRDFAILRQVHDDGENDVRQVFSNIRAQVKEFTQVLSLGPAAGRNLIDSGKGKLDTLSQQVLATVEDLQDLVEDLKLDVSRRGVKPKASEMKRVTNDIATATRRLGELEQFIQNVKPSWKRTWEAELQNIVDEQEFLNYQEGLLVDLQQDHKALQDVFANIQQVVRLRNMQQKGDTKAPRYVPPAPDHEHEGLGTVMIEVRGQSIDHERRLRALQTAERSREKARQGRVDEFADELAGFVDNKALRKTGGHRETERIRMKRDQATLRAMFSSSSFDSMSSDTVSRSASRASFRTDNGSGTEDIQSPVAAHASSNEVSEANQPSAATATSS
ncbi:Bud site selection protein 6 [Malassezia cuniculi]|uniref:Bud site selection protein 6 n=1 Tax=Malassezia cuniculi TaxID=948313 RepID=A0AAF0J753_9BASI|nr:Bud site selection protein 6 [Malassezia cuniculi]